MRAKILLIGDAALFLSDFSPSRKAFSLAEGAPTVGIGYQGALSVPRAEPAQERVVAKLSIVRQGMVERKMEATALFAH